MKCDNINPCQLRQTITIQRKDSVPDGAGGWTTDWVDRATVRAMVKPLSGRERMEYERIQATVRYRCVIRFRDDLLASDRVVYKGRAYMIRYFFDIEERRRWLELALEDGVAT